MIYVVDDHEDTRVFLSRLLQRSGYDTEALSDGSSALKRMQLCHPALVILDYNMPGLDGLEVLKAIRSAPDLCQIPVVMFTAVDADSIADKARRLGVQAFWRKGAIEWSACIDDIVRVIGTDHSTTVPAAIGACPPTRATLS